jgi:hypothetical protein
MPLSSTGFINLNLNEADDNQSPVALKKPAFSVQLTPKKLKKLQALNQKNQLGLDFPQGEGLDLIEAFNRELTKLIQIEDTLEEHADKLLLKKYKVAIIKAFETQLEQLTQQVPTEEEKKQDSLLKRFLRRLGYGFLLTFGLIMDGIGSFLGGQELIYLIPGVTGPIALIVGIAFSLINSALFYSFEAGMLKQAMGLDSMDEIGSQLELDEDEIVHTRKINELMLGKATDKLDKPTYSVYARLADTLNKSVLGKKQFQQPELPEKTSHKILRHIITGVGAVMVAGYSYFMANSLLVFAAPALIGTPLGWIFIGLGVATMLAYYLSMRGKAMVNMLNPSMQKFKDVKVQFDQFQPKTEAEFKLAYDTKKEQTTVVALRQEIKALKRENMDLKGKLIQDKLLKKPVFTNTTTILQESQAFWQKATPRGPLREESSSIKQGLCVNSCSSP